MQMSIHDFQQKWKLVWEWDGICIVCGHEFANIACVTTDHIIPKSRGGKNGNYNKAPAHYRCNQLKGAESLIVASKLIVVKRESMRPDEFVAWLNKPVPHRHVPHHATIALRKRRCLELPDRVAGMTAKWKSKNKNAK